MPLAIRDAERVLRQMLVEHGLDPRAPQPVDQAWRVFAAFAQLPSEATGPDGDGVLYESGTFAFSGPEAFHLSFVRQFEVLDEDGEHDHYEQLRCGFRFPVSAETAAFGRYHAWWFASGDEPWSAFAAMVEARPEFVAFRTAAATVGIAQEEV